jgi:hypothetical protein
MLGKIVRTGKEFARHMLHSLGRRRGLDYLQGDRAARFATIYRTGVWQLGDTSAPGSGLGSTLEVTEPLRQALPSLVQELNVGTLLDIGCGDFTWMRNVDLGCDYVGIDIVESVIDTNRAAFASPSRQFLLQDAVEGLGDLRADLVLCREVLFHLSFADAKALLRNALGTGCQHLLLTSDEETAFNADIESGDFRVINLQRRPFAFPAPTRRIEDSRLVGGRFLGLWPAAAIKKALG